MTAGSSTATVTRSASWAASTAPAPCRVAAAPGASAGQPGIWDQSIFPDPATGAAATRHGAGAVLAAHEAVLVTVAVDDPAVIDDLNTPEDYERLIREVNRDIY